jgi:diacylglycerol kinase family enzyme
VAWGGDGTINEVASALAFGPVPLGIVPCGSGNGLARALGVARQPDTALRSAASASPRAIDAGEIGGRLFFNVAGVGFDAHVAEQFDRRSGHRGFPAYVGICARALLTYRSASYRIGTSGAERRALLVTLANSREFGNGACIAPLARVDDGRLDLVIFEEISRLRTLFAVPSLFSGRIAAIRGFSSEQIEHVTIRSDAPMTFHVDGEPAAGGTAIEARVHARALDVCV